ncbi:AraC family transcriptional regulator [Chryseobacterium sp. BIGb0232]|uniref:helix-turn-helix domain-containing protein n=1 Tax=Chryseobacterium sp. BIGb0232 TaxID=2940598 RepID=UPI000F4A4E1A|nr:AraC family transcriptional regulator [Chryseobacterium sp. BIGb0232]MCS4305460.1 AraC-like DNA-binding protein [Chryseobacterium sp. BIGb0232]ROS07132.1 AraC-like DNA-binding protein [Chryseobacterium nakagawai]
MESVRDVESYSISYVSEKIGLQNVEGIVVNRAEDSVRKGLTNYPHTVNGFICAICVKGRAELKINFQKRLLEPNMLMVVLPGSMMEPIEISEDLHIDTIFFDLDFISKDSLSSNYLFFHEVRQIPCLRLNNEGFEIFRQHHTSISTHYHREESRSKTDILQFLLLALLAEVKDVYNTNGEQGQRYTRATELTVIFFDLLYRHHKEERSVSFYAQKMHLTSKYLTTIIRKQTGKSILVWINEAVIAQAKSLLKTTNLSVMEITDILNFTEPSLFCRFFKRYTSITPSAYRRN